MGKCEWCGKNVDNLVNYTDAIGDTHFICSECNSNVEKCQCRKCGSPVDVTMMINGLCANCIQADIAVKNKRKEEAKVGMDHDVIEHISSEITLSDSDYERWLTFGNTFTPQDMKSSKELKRLWIMVKFNSAGIYDGDTIAKHFKDIETLLDRNFSKLVGNKCRILIANSPETRKVVRQLEVIDYENETYILKV